MKKGKPIDTRPIVARNILLVMETLKWDEAVWGKLSGISSRAIRYYAAQERSPSAETLAKLAAPAGLQGWELQFPHLTAEMIQSGDLAEMGAAYADVSPETKAYVKRVLMLDLAKLKAG